jgi:predicted DNA-binding transcriptional regulator YafY
MRMDRLLNMVVLLVNRRRVRAKELAEYFGVTVRTVYRDIDTICQAGIPVVSFPGLNGGLGIAEGYRLDRTVMSEDELVSVMVALQSVSSSYEDAHAAAVQEKIRAVVTDRQAERFRVRTESIRIDFSPWGTHPRLKADVELLKEAIESKSRVRFQYCSVKGEMLSREAEPYTLVLKNNHWYLYAFCLLRQEFRFFKLARMGELERLSPTFLRREMNLDELPWEQERQDPSRTVEMVLRFPMELRLLVEDWFGRGQGVPEPGREDRYLLVQAAWPEDEWLYGFLLSFGDRMEILEPVRLREHIRAVAGRIVSLYSHGGSQ